MTTVIAPSTGAGILLTQGGVGAAPGYTAIDVRRAAGLALTQGIVGSSAYLVSQRGAGANMSVDIAANSGLGLAVAGTTIAAQGPYGVPPHSAVINEVIATADPTNPRVDQLVVETFDNTIDSSGNNKSQTTVLAGTPTGGATIGIGGNRNGAAALPANTIRLADVIVGAGVTSITNANIFDRRPKTRGASNIATTETRTNTAYGVMPTPDQVTELVMPTNGYFIVLAQMTWQESVAGAGRAAIFLNTTQQVAQSSDGTISAIAPKTIAAATGSATAANDVPLITSSAGLISVATGATGLTPDVTTGQALGYVKSFLGGALGARGQIAAEVGGTVTLIEEVAPGVCYIFAAAGTYHLSMQAKSTSGSVTLKNRRLGVFVVDPSLAVLA